MKRAWQRSGPVRRAALGATAVAVALLAAGCETDEDFDHAPPAGLGTLIIDNGTYDDIDVFVDGRDAGRAGDDSERIVDLRPGVHRVVLDEHGGSRNWRSDVDILEGRQTILRVSISWGGGYEVNTDFE